MKKIKFDWQWLLFVLSIGIYFLYNCTSINFSATMAWILSLASLVCIFFFVLWLDKQKDIIKAFIALSSTIGIFPTLILTNSKRESGPRAVIASIIIIFVLFIGSYLFLRMAYLIKILKVKNKQKFIKPCTGIGIGFLIIGLYFLISTLVVYIG